MKILAWYKRRGHTKKIEAAWPSALLLLSGGLKAGLPLNEALDVVIKETSGPLHSQLMARLEQCGPWVPLQKKIEIVLSDDYLALPRAILFLSHESGGKTAALLDICADILARKIDMRERAMVLSAEGRASAWVVGLSPFVLLFVLSVLSPDFVRPLFVFPTGRLLLLVMVGLIAVGCYWIGRAVRIEP